MTTSGLSRPWAVWNEGRVSLSARTEGLIAGRLLDLRMGLAGDDLLERLWFAADTEGGLGKRYSVTGEPSSLHLWTLPADLLYVGLNRTPLDVEGPNAYASAPPSTTSARVIMVDNETVGGREA
jgi:hypothetical protein